MIRFLIFIVAMAGCLQGLRRERTPVIRLVGSDTMLLLTQRWAERFMLSDAGSGTAVYVEGGGSTRGIQLFIDGKSDICASSRPLSATEVHRLAEEHGTVGLAHRVALDALSVYVHPSNPVVDLTIDQIARIFTGEIQNWKEVGGSPAPIHVITRNPSSGTYYYFKEHVLGEAAYSPRAEPMPTTAAIVQRIAADSLAIGYGGLGYGTERVRSLRVNGIEAVDENVRNDTYPIRRYLVFYTLKFPSGSVRSFIDWVVSDEGQVCVREAGYIPLFTAP